MKWKRLEEFFASSWTFTVLWRPLSDSHFEYNVTRNCIKNTVDLFVQTELLDNILDIFAQGIIVTDIVYTAYHVTFFADKHF